MLQKAYQCLCSAEDTFLVDAAYVQQICMTNWRAAIALRVRREARTLHGRIHSLYRNKIKESYAPGITQVTLLSYVPGTRLTQFPAAPCSHLVMVSDAQQRT